MATAAERFGSVQSGLTAAERFGGGSQVASEPLVAAPLPERRMISNRSGFNAALNPGSTGRAMGLGLDRMDAGPVPRELAPATIGSRDPRMLPSSGTGISPLREFYEPLIDPVVPGVKRAARGVAEFAEPYLEATANMERGDSGLEQLARYPARLGANLISVPFGMATQLPDRFINPPEGQNALDIGVEEAGGMADWMRKVPAQVLSSLFLGARPRNPLIDLLASVGGQTTSEYYDEALADREADAGAGMVFGLSGGIKGAKKMRSRVLPEKTKVSGRYLESNLIPETRRLPAPEVSRARAITELDRMRTAEKGASVKPPVEPVQPEFTQNIPKNIPRQIEPPVQIEPQAGPRAAVGEPLPTKPVRPMKPLLSSEGAKTQTAARKIHFENRQNIEAAKLPYKDKQKLYEQNNKQLSNQIKQLNAEATPTGKPVKKPVAKVAPKAPVVDKQGRRVFELDKHGRKDVEMLHGTTLKSWQEGASGAIFSEVDRSGANKGGSSKRSKLVTTRTKYVSTAPEFWQDNPSGKPVNRYDRVQLRTALKKAQEGKPLTKDQYDLVESAVGDFNSWAEAQDFAVRSKDGVVHEPPSKAPATKASRKTSRVATDLKDALKTGAVTFTAAGGAVVAVSEALSKLSDDEQDEMLKAGVGLAGLLAFAKRPKVRDAARTKAKRTQTTFERFQDFQAATLMDPTGIIGKSQTPFERRGKVKGKRRQRWDPTNAPGIATRTTKAGNLVPAIRQSGSFVPKDFSDYHKARKAAGAKDINFKERFATVDASRVLEEIDGALRISEQAKLPDQAGPTVRYVDWRRKELTSMKMDWTGERVAEAKAAIKGLSKKERKLASDALRQIGPDDVNIDPAALLKRPTIKAPGVTVEVVKAAQGARNLFNVMFDHQNTGRRNRFQAEIPMKGAQSGKPFYVPETIARMNMFQVARERILGNTALKKAQEGPGLPDFVHLNKNFNARELKNLGLLPESLLEKDLGILLENYINTAAKDIFDTQIIQNNKAFIQQLRAEGFPGGASFIERWTDEAFAGKAAWIDDATPWNSQNRFWRGLKGTSMGIRKSLSNSVFPANIKWALATQPSSMAFTVLKTGPVNTVLGMTDFMFNKKLRDKITSLYPYKVKASGSLASIQDIGARPASRAVVLRRKKEAWNSFLSVVMNYNEKYLTGSSIAAGMRHGKRLGLKGRALEEYAANVGARTQSMYNVEDRVGLLRSEIVKTGATFQTFTFEGVSNLREFFGTTGTPPEKGMQRIGQLGAFLGAAMAINAGTNAAFGSEPWSHKSFLPFYEQLVAPIWNELSGTPYKTTRSVPTAVGVAAGFGRAARKVYTKDDWSDLNKWGVKYLPGFWGIGGGTQAVRIIDAIEDVARGESVTTDGKTRFEITSSTDAARAYIFGSYGTSGGGKYIRGRNSVKGKSTVDKLLGANPFSIDWYDQLVNEEDEVPNAFKPRPKRARGRKVRPKRRKR